MVSGALREKVVEEMVSILYFQVIQEQAKQWQPKSLQMN